MREATAISDLPRVPAIYALYGGEGRRYVAHGRDLDRYVAVEPRRSLGRAWGSA